MTQVSPHQTTILDEVKLNSKVKVKYVNNGKDLIVHLVQTENNKDDIANKIKKIYYRSPLAISLLGHTVGDVVKVGHLDNFVQIMEVTN